MLEHAQTFQCLFSFVSCFICYIGCTPATVWLSPDGLDGIVVKERLTHRLLAFLIRFLFSARLSLVSSISASLALLCPCLSLSSLSLRNLSPFCGSFFLVFLSASSTALLSASSVETISLYHLWGLGTPACCLSTAFFLPPFLPILFSVTNPTPLFTVCAYTITMSVVLSCYVYFFTLLEPLYCTFTISLDFTLQSGSLSKWTVSVGLWNAKVTRCTPVSH